MIDRGYGGDLTFTRTLGLRAPVSLVVPLRGDARARRTTPYFCVNFGVCDTTTIDDAALAPAALAGDRSARRSTAPTSRSRRRAATSRARARACVAGHGLRLRVQPRLRRGGAVLARWAAARRRARDACSASASCGAYGGPNGDDVLHPRKRFYAGGSQSVRGYGENQLGPRILTLPRGFLIYATDRERRPVTRSSETFASATRTSSPTPPAQPPSATTSSRRARSAARRSSRGAWSTAFRCPS